MKMRQRRRHKRSRQRCRVNLRTRYPIFAPIADALGISVGTLAADYDSIDYSSARQHLMFEESTKLKDLSQWQRELIDMLDQHQTQELIDMLIQDRIKNPPMRFEVKRVDYENGDLNKLRIVQPLPVINPWK